MLVLKQSIDHSLSRSINHLVNQSYKHLSVFFWSRSCVLLFYQLVGRFIKQSLTLWVTISWFIHLIKVTHKI